MSTQQSDTMMQRSKDSASMVPYWNKVDAIIDGIEALRLAGEDYLPKFVDETPTEYAFRIKMTKMTNVYRDIVEGLTAKPFEQEIQLLNPDEVPDQIGVFIDDVDGSSNSLNIFASSTFFNGVNGAIAWIFVDFSKFDPSVVTMEDARRAGVRPYWSQVLGRNVLDVQSTVKSGVETLTYFKVLEPGNPDYIREFVRGDDGVVMWTLYRKTEDYDNERKTYFVVEDSGRLDIDVIPMVPFITGRRNGRTWKVFPAMKDAADLQIELYQQESALKFAKVLTAYPMLAANGIEPEKGADGKPKKVAVGPNRVLYSRMDAAGKVGNWSYLEPSSESLKFLADENDRTIRELRELGRQPLTAQSGNITVITAAVAAGKARSAVKQWALALKDALENALLMTAKWLDVTDYDPTVHVFIEFDDFMEGEDLDALLSMRNTNNISRRTLHEEMKRRGVLSSNFTEDREEQRLLEELPGDGPDTTMELDDAG